MRPRARTADRPGEDLSATDIGAANRAWAEADRYLVDQAYLAPFVNGVVAEPLSERVGNAQVHPLWSLLLSRVWVR